MGTEGTGGCLLSLPSYKTLTLCCLVLDKIVSQMYSTYIFHKTLHICIALLDSYGGLCHTCDYVISRLPYKSRNERGTSLPTFVVHWLLQMN